MPCFGAGDLLRPAYLAYSRINVFFFHKSPVSHANHGRQRGGGAYGVIGLRLSVVFYETGKEDRSNRNRKQ